MENLREERLLLERLNIEGLQYDGFHDIIEVRVRGTLPRDREKMLAKLDAAIMHRQALPPVFAVIE